MDAETYAKEVEFVVRQVDDGTLMPVLGWHRIQLLTIAYRSDPNTTCYDPPREARSD